MTDTTTQERNIADGKFYGWTNYATWRINLEMWDGVEVEQYDDLSDLADYLKDSSEEMINETSSGLANDYALAFLSDVNWYEIAEHLMPNESEE